METHKIDYKKELKEALDVALFKQPVMHTVAADKNKTKFAYIIIIIGAILGIIGQQLLSGIFRPGLLFSVVMGVLQVVMAVVGIYVISFIAKKLFKGQAEHDQFFRVSAYGMIIMWLSLIPQISIITGIWELILLYVILKAIHKLTTGNAVLTIVVAVIVLWIFSAILTPIYARFGAYGVIGNSSLGANVGSLNFGDKGKIDYNGGSMKYTDENGKTVEVNIPNMNQ